jgi:hypothetical protein
MLDPLVLTFIAGGIAGYLKFPTKLSKIFSSSLSSCLLLSIGFKGGLELANTYLPNLIDQAFYVILMGLALPLLAFPILRYIGKIDLKNAASIAAHYGSVSVGTFAVGIAFLQSMGVDFESYTPVFVAVLEVPAIIIGILLAKKFRLETLKDKSILKEIFLAKSILLIMLGILIGSLIGKESFLPLYASFLLVFKIMLGFFLFDMGQVAVKELKVFKLHGKFLFVFAVCTPIIFAIIGGVLGYHIGLSAGGSTILAILAASASYIAVPAAMKISVPEASPSLSLGASLGITFPFNVVLGIPLYYKFVSEIIF